MKFPIPAIRPDGTDSCMLLSYATALATLQPVGVEVLVMEMAMFVDPSVATLADAKAALAKREALGKLAGIQQGSGYVRLAAYHAGNSLYPAQ